jgi:hypothetical protein
MTDDGKVPNLDGKVSKLDKLIENDGFIYCIKTNLKYSDKDIVKIGKTKFGNKNSKKEVENHIMQRYGTYYPDCSILHLQRVGDHHRAEKMIFRLLNRYHVKKEFFYQNDKNIKFAFKKITLKYPNIDVFLNKNNAKDLTKINVVRREEL